MRYFFVSILWAFSVFYFSRPRIIISSNWTYIIDIITKTEEDKIYLKKALLEVSPSYLIYRKN